MNIAVKVLIVSTNDKNFFTKCLYNALPMTIMHDSDT